MVKAPLSVRTWVDLLPIVTSNILFPFRFDEINYTGFGESGNTKL
jgi:hypothetical protein